MIYEPRAKACSRCGEGESHVLRRLCSGKHRSGNGIQEAGEMQWPLSDPGGITTVSVSSIASQRIKESKRSSSCGTKDVVEVPDNKDSV